MRGSRREAPPASSPQSPQDDLGSRVSIPDELSDIHVRLVNLTHTLKKVMAQQSSRELTSIGSGLQRIIDDAKAMRLLADDATAPKATTGPQSPPPTTPGAAAAKVQKASDATTGVVDPVVTSISSIGSRFGVSTARLREMNPHLDKYASDEELPQSTPVRLRRGAPSATAAQRERESPPQKVPKPSGAATAHGKVPAAPVTEEPSAVVARPPQKQTASAARAASSSRAAAPPGVDTIRSIATNIGVTVVALVAANTDVLEGFDIDDPLPPNIDLVIPEGRRVEERIWTRKGDSWRGLARETGVAVASLRALNPTVAAGLDDNAPLPVGLEIALPRSSSVAAQHASRPPNPQHSEDARAADPSSRGRRHLSASAVEADDFDDRDDYVEDDGSEGARFETDDGYGSLDDDDDDDDDAATVVTIKLRYPTSLEQIANDHGCTITTLQQLNEPGPRGGRLHVALLADPTMRAPAGASVRVPVPTRRGGGGDARW